MRFFFIFLLLPVKLLSQDIAGVWVGSIYNDTTHKYIPYEIAISETKGKLTGYSQTIFTGDNNRQEMGIKSLKIKEKSDKILIEDDALLYNNYLEPAPKGVRQYSVLNVVRSDSGLLLIGVFNTNKTKEYAPLTGTIRLQKKEKIKETKLIPKLEELNLSASLSFVNDPRKENPVIGPQTKEIVQEAGKKNMAIPATTVAADSQSSRKEQRKDIAINAPHSKPKPALITNTSPAPLTIQTDTIGYTVDVIPAEDIPKLKKQRSELKTTRVTEKRSGLLQLPPKHAIALNESTEKQIADYQKRIIAANIAKEEVKQPVTLHQTPDNSKALLSKRSVGDKPVKVITIIPAKEEKISQPVQQKKADQVKVAADPATTKSDAGMAEREQPKAPVISVNSIVKSLPGPFIPAVSTSDLAKRKIETIRSVNFTSDSLVLTLYDNGEVDGDTVSVILNGKTIMSKQRLTEKALSKTIYITPDLGDSLQLIMYAENLGSIPPNTGLLIIQDGEERYEIRFAGDLQKNSAILLKRKTNR